MLFQNFRETWKGTRYWKIFEKYGKIKKKKKKKKKILMQTVGLIKCSTAHFSLLKT